MMRATVEETLSKISGIDKKEIREICTEVIENNKLLKSCDNHLFDIEVDKRKFQCSNCKGTVSSFAKHWYERGYGHGF